MFGVSIGKKIELGAIGLCSLLIIGSQSVQAKTNSEVEAEAVALWDRMAAAAGTDYDEFRSCYTDDSNEDGIMSDFEFDWSNYTGKDQHFATVIAAADPYYYINVTSAICAGSYPNAHNEFANWAVLMEDTEDGLKSCLSQEKGEKANQEFDFGAVYPEGCLEASNYGRNATEFNNSMYWYMNPDNVIWGPLCENLKFAWQDEEGNLYFAILVNNGSGGNRYYTSMTLTLTDDALGTVFDGELTDNVVEGTLSIMNGKNELLICKVDSAEVLTGTQTWGSMNYSLGSTHQ